MPTKQKMTHGKDIKFERVRRITGYLTSEKKWNDAKLAELKDRVTHTQ